MVTAGNVTVGVADDNTLTTSTGNLVLDSNSGLLVFKDNTLFEGSATVSGTLTLGTSQTVSDIVDLINDQSSTSLVTENAVWDYVASQIGSAQYWQLNSAALSPSISSYDLLVGGASTASAKFQVLADSGSATVGGTLAVRSIPTISNRGLLLTQDASTGVLSFVDTSAWDTNASNDLLTTDLGVTVQGYNANTSFLGQAGTGYPRSICVI